MKESEDFNSKLVENGDNYAKELNFECPYFKDNRSCIDCQIAKRGTWSDETRLWTYTGVCTEWQKKHWPGACGCGGYYECECGFKEWFCFEFGRINCPFCGKAVKKHTLRGIIGILQEIIK